MQQIPRTIHWCWLSGDPIPAFLEECMASWRKRLPGYTFKCWTQDNFDVHAVPWVEQAVGRRIWAFAADYIRLWAVHNEGGIYLDMDVEVLKPFDRMLGYDFFTGTAFNAAPYKRVRLPIDEQGRPLDASRPVDGYGLQGAIFGAKAGNRFVAECLEYYHNRSFLREDGTPVTDMTLPYVMAKVAEKYGFVYHDRDQVLDTPGAGTHIVFDSGMFPDKESQLQWRTHAAHHCAGSWVSGSRATWRMLGSRTVAITACYQFKNLFHRLCDPLTARFRGKR